MLTLATCPPRIGAARTVLRVAVVYHRSKSTTVQQNIPIPKKTKVWESADEAVKDIKSGSIVLAGGKCTELLLQGEDCRLNAS